jgi:hypothetical protein
MNQVVPPKPKFNLITPPGESVSSDANYALSSCYINNKLLEPH